MFLENPQIFVWDSQNREQGVSREKLEVSNQNLRVSNEKLWLFKEALVVSVDKLMVSNNNLGSQTMNSLGFLMIVLGLQWNSEGLWWKACGILNIWLVSNEKLEVCKEDLGVSDENLWVFYENSHYQPIINHDSVDDSI